LLTCISNVYPRSRNCRKVVTGSMRHVYFPLIIVNGRRPLSEISFSISEKVCLYQRCIKTVLAPLKICAIPSNALFISIILLLSYFGIALVVSGFHFPCLRSRPSCYFRGEKGSSTCERFSVHPPTRLSGP